MKILHTRRQFLERLGIGAAGAMLANAGLPAAAAGARSLSPLTEAFYQAQGTPRVQLLIGDVIAFQLQSDDWAGPFGSVTLQLHKALYNNEEVFYIRTDASDQQFAEENRLVHVPLLNAALQAEGSTGQLYSFENGADDQYPIVSTIPGNDDFSSAWHVQRVTFNGEPEFLGSVEAINEAQAAGAITVEPTSLVVNFPVIKWPGGELPADTQRTQYLGTGPLLAPVDTNLMEVTFKLHECFPGSRYFFTDTSSVPMAPGMNIAASPPTQALQDVGATDEIWVFGNGIPGSGVMGFQPAVFDNEPGSPVWSPFWQHFTAVWTNEENARVIRNSNELRQLADAGELQIFNGVPDMPQDMPPFVVNCPVPIRATNVFDPNTFVSAPSTGGGSSSSTASTTSSSSSTDSGSIISRSSSSDTRSAAQTGNLPSSAATAEPFEAQPTAQPSPTATPRRQNP
ncbi:MAG: hypothetical protein D6737_09210 [Chloroflexi bacterium]|nr:MAG: hypothetical protein CUN54_03080 [Phototrophicales bacterium]RMF80081.1 MAG: hypothetical protein D6737_09210 [Chloroflexota bacterium]